MTPFPLLDDLPRVELQALELDGDVYRLGDGYVPIGIPPAPATRAAAALGNRSPRLISALGTAAWVWGAARHPPRDEFLVDLGARWRPPFGDGPVVIESHVHPGDLVRWGRLSVTTPLRTALDLARFRERFGDDDADAVRRLARIGGFGLGTAVRTMDRRRNLAGKRVATERLRAALSPS